MEETGLSMIESMFVFCNNVMSYEWTWMGHTFTLWNIPIIAAIEPNTATNISMFHKVKV